MELYAPFAPPLVDFRDFVPRRCRRARISPRPVSLLRASTGAGPSPQSTAGRSEAPTGQTKAVEAPPLQAPAPEPAAGNQVATISTSLGDITIELFKDRAPVSVENFLQYVADGFYDGHHLPSRQAGIHDPRRRIHPVVRAKSRRGPRSRTRRPTACATPAARWRWRARAALRSATSQFYINVADNAALDHTRLLARRIRLRRFRSRADRHGRGRQDRRGPTGTTATAWTTCRSSRS